MALVAKGRSYRLIGREVGLSKNTVADIIQDRILPNVGWTQWFVAHGMPYSTAVQSTQGG